MGHKCAKKKVVTKMKVGKWCWWWGGWRRAKTHGGGPTLQRSMFREPVISAWITTSGTQSPLLFRSVSEATASECHGHTHGGTRQVPCRLVPGPIPVLRTGAAIMPQDDSGPLDLAGQLSGSATARARLQACVGRAQRAWSNSHWCAGFFLSA